MTATSEHKLVAELIPSERHPSKALPSEFNGRQVNSDSMTQIKISRSVTEYYPQVLKMSFKRTLRVADNGKVNNLPPSLGAFPLYEVADYKDRLPSDMVGQGGFFFPMYQREAMWIKFTSSQPFAIKIYVGGVNAVSAEPALETEATMMKRLKLMEKRKTIQDYVVTPDQLWLDGIATGNGIIRQFVAMPLGSGYSVEAEITGSDTIGGLQIEITPAKLAPFRELSSDNGLHLPNFQSMPEPDKRRIPDGEDQYTLRINRVGGDVFGLDVTQKYTIAEVKIIVMSLTGLSPRDQRFVFFNRILDDESMTLEDYKVFKGSLINLVLNSGDDALVTIPSELCCHIHVTTLTSKTLVVAISDCVTVEDLKILIQQREGIPPDQQRLIYRGKQLIDGSTLKDCGITKGSRVHSVLRLRGGGGEKFRPPPVQMGIAAGGIIKQTIKRDRCNPLTWDPHAGIVFNVQMLNSDLFAQFTSFKPPPTPVSAFSYAMRGLPYFAMWDEPDSEVFGDFDAVQSVKKRDQTGMMTEEKKKAVAEVSQSLHNPVVLLNYKGERVGFRPVKIMEREVREKFREMKI